MVLRNDMKNECTVSQYVWHALELALLNVYVRERQTYSNICVSKPTMMTYPNINEKFSRRPLRKVKEKRGPFTTYLMITFARCFTEKYFLEKQKQA